MGSNQANRGWWKMRRKCMREEMKELIYDFINCCESQESARIKNIKCSPTFENFILWIKDQEYYME